MEGTSYVCKTDEVGEICVSSEATGSQYWGLTGLSNSTFKVQPLLADGKPLSEVLYVRSGLLGFLGPVSSMFYWFTFRFKFDAVLFVASIIWYYSVFHRLLYEYAYIVSFLLDFNNFLAIILY